MNDTTGYKRRIILGPSSGVLQSTWRKVSIDFSDRCVVLFFISLVCMAGATTLPSRTLLAQSTEENPILPFVVVNNPNRDTNELTPFFDPALTEGETGPFEFEDTLWEFIDVPTEGWFDPVTTEGYLYEIIGGSLFTDIVNFPSGFSSPFDVWAENTLLGSFTPGQSVDFVASLGHGVNGFAVLGISPKVDPTDQDAFPLQLAFDTPTASFSMQGLRSSAAVPEPSTFLLGASGLLALALYSWRRRRAA